MCRGVLYLAMIVSDQQREENYQEYLRLKANSNYYDVYFDEYSGGVSAIHRDHKLDSEKGAYGIKIGDYEKRVVDILRKKGHYITLESELAPNGVKTPDGVIDGEIMEIKVTDGYGKWAIKDKLHKAARQGAWCVILYFHKKELFSIGRLEDGWARYINDKDSQNCQGIINKIICIIENEEYVWSPPI